MKVFVLSRDSHYVCIYIVFKKFWNLFYAFYCYLFPMCTFPRILMSSEIIFSGCILIQFHKSTIHFEIIFLLSFTLLTTLSCIYLFIYFCGIGHRAQRLTLNCIFTLLKFNSFVFVLWYGASNSRLLSSALFLFLVLRRGLLHC